MRFRWLCAGFAAILLCGLLAPLSARAEEPPPPPPPTHMVSGTVTSGATSFPGSGVAACPFVSDPSAPSGFRADCDHAIIALADPSGAYTVTVLQTAAYALVGFADYGTFLSITGTVVHSTVPDQGYYFVPGGGGDLVNRDFDIPFPGTTFSGTVSRTGLATFPPQTGGVGACPQTPGQPPNLGPTCVGLRFVFANPDRTYRLRLKADVEWRVGAFYFVDGVPVGGDEQHDIPVVDGADQTLNLSADVATPDPDNNPATAVVPAQGDDPANAGDLGLTAANGVALSNVKSFPVSKILTPPPDQTIFPYGVLSFTAGPVAQNGTVVIDLTFPDGTLAPAATWYKLRGGRWVAYDDPATPGPDVVHPPGQPNVLRITLADHGYGDDDGMANGYVTDPGAVGGPPGPTNKDQCKNNGWRNGPYRNQGDCVSHFATAKAKTK